MRQSRCLSSGTPSSGSRETLDQFSIAGTNANPSFRSPPLSCARTPNPVTKLWPDVLTDCCRISRRESWKACARAGRRSAGNVNRATSAAARPNDSTNHVRARSIGRVPFARDRRATDAATLTTTGAPRKAHPPIRRSGGRPLSVLRRLREPQLAVLALPQSIVGGEARRQDPQRDQGTRVLVSQDHLRGREALAR